MNELKNKVILAKFPPVTPGAPYSPALVNICHALLNRWVRGGMCGWVLA
jgi:hypothetical protein